MESARQHAPHRTGITVGVNPVLAAASDTSRAYDESGATGA